MKETLSYSDISIEKASKKDIDEILEVEHAAWPSTDGAMTAEKEKFVVRQKIGGLFVAKSGLSGKIIGMINSQKPLWSDSKKVSEMSDFMKNEGEYFSSITPAKQWNIMKNRFGFPGDWYSATNSGYIEMNGTTTHDPETDVSFLIGVSIHPQGRGNKLVDLLIQAVISESKSQGMKYTMGYARMPALQSFIKKAKDYINGGLEEKDYMGDVLERISEKNSEMVERLSEIDPEKPQPGMVEQVVSDYMKLKKPGTKLPMDYGLRFHARNGAELVSPIPNAMFDDNESLTYGALALYNLGDM